MNQQEVTSTTIKENTMMNKKDEIKYIMLAEAVKKINYPFKNWTVQEVMKDLRVSEATANAIFKRKDFPSVNIGKTKTVTLLAYLIWKMERKESEVNEDESKAE